MGHDGFQFLLLMISLTMDNECNTQL